MNKEQITQYLVSTARFDGYLNATKACQNFCSKDFGQFNRLPSTKRLVLQIASQYSIEKSSVVCTKRGKRSQTFIHPDMLDSFCMWIINAQSNKSHKQESSFQDWIARKLSKALKCKVTREVPCSYGVIDIFTPFSIIEVKNVVQWKGAIGQVLTYGLDYPKRKKGIVLYFRDDQPIDFEMIFSICNACKQLDIFVEFLGVDNNKIYSISQKVYKNGVPANSKSIEWMV